MKTSRDTSPYFAGIDVALPEILTIAGRQLRTGSRVRTVIGLTMGQVDNVIVPLLQHWLLQHYHRYFVEKDRSSDSALAATAFHEKVLYQFAGDRPFMAALVFSQRGPPRPAMSDFLNSPPPNHTNARHHAVHWASRLMAGGDLARWRFIGVAHAHLPPRGDAAQVTFDHLPGAIEMIGPAASGVSAPEGSSPHGQETLAWYGFGVPAYSLAKVKAKLRNDIHELRRADTKPRAA